MTIALGLAALTASAGLATIGPAPAAEATDGDYRACVTTREYRAVKTNMRKGKVRQILDGRGRVVNPRVREYTACGSQDKVRVRYDRQYKTRGAKVVRKWRVPVESKPTNPAEPVVITRREVRGEGTVTWNGERTLWLYSNHKIPTCRSDETMVSYSFNRWGHNPGLMRSFVSDGRYGSWGSSSLIDKPLGWWSRLLVNPEWAWLDIRLEDNSQPTIVIPSTRSLDVRNQFRIRLDADSHESLNRIGRPASASIITYWDVACEWRP